jgi:hypothetical protein
MLSERAAIPAAAQLLVRDPCGSHVPFLIEPGWVTPEKASACVQEMGPGSLLSPIARRLGLTFLTGTRTGLRFGLGLNERLGGHVIAKHVGLTDAQLVGRAAREGLDFASTFASREAAENAIRSGLTSNYGRVRAFIESDLKGTEIVEVFNRPVGRVYNAAAKSFYDSAVVRIVLRKRFGIAYVKTVVIE